MTDLDAVGSGVFASESNGPICVQGVEFFSLCEHHLLPFWGSASVAYLPGNKILGLSKVARIVDMYARRLQVQERLTSEVVECIKRAVNPRAVVVAVEAQHMCMMMRGVNKVGSSTKTQVVWHADDVSSQELDRLIAQLTRG
jgi:GTP cyclohydrolase I